MPWAKPIIAVAQDLQISTKLLYAWRSQGQRSQGVRFGLLAYGSQSYATALRALRREVALLRSENDILKKAAIILGSRPQLSSAK